MYRPDEDIDRLSREAAEHYHAPGKPAWDALREALDKELPQEKEKKRRGFLFFFLLALGLSVAGTAIWYGVKTTAANTDKTMAAHQQVLNGTAVHTQEAPTTAKDNTTTNAATAATKANTTQVNPKAVADQPASLPNNAAANVAVAKTNHLHPIKADANNSAAPAVAAGNKSASPNSNANKTAIVTSLHKDYLSPSEAVPAGKTSTVYSKKKARPAVNNSVLKNKNRQQPNSPATNSKEDSKDVADVSTEETKEGISKDTQNKVVLAPVAVQDSLDHQPAAVAAAPVKESLPAAVKKDSAKPAVAKTKNKSKNDKAILLGITGGIDLSTVRFTYGSDIGYNIGLMGGYQFNKHWSAYTGIVYTKKNYKLNGEDYHPPKHYWTQYVNLETVEGYCRMWELPLLARYTFNPSARTSFFVSAGVSSYFMKKQDYTYYYKTSTGMPGTMPWTNDSSYNHIFSILDLSVGVQKQIGKHMSWQIEPYAKIPLGGVGFGNIRLSSFGVNLTVQYRQPIKR